MKLDPTLRWQLAEIIELNNDKIKFKIIDSKKNKDVFGILNYNNIKWTIPSNKTIVDRHNVADIIFVKKNKKTVAIKAVSKSKRWYSSFKSSYRRCKSFSRRI